MAQAERWLGQSARGLWLPWGTIPRLRLARVPSCLAQGTRLHKADCFWSRGEGMLVIVQEAGWLQRARVTDPGLGPESNEATETSVTKINPILMQEVRMNRTPTF